MAGEEGSEQKAATAEETSPNPTQQTSATDGVRTPERCTTDPQAEAQIEAEDQEGYDDEEADLDYQDDAVYDGYDEDDYEYGSESDYDSENEDEDDYDWEFEFAKHRPAVRAALLSFPEAANLSPTELDAAVERALEQSKPEYRDVAAPGKIRLSKHDIEPILTPLPPITVTLDLASSEGTSLYPADLIRRREELDKEYEEFQSKVRKDLIEKGYAEVVEDYFDVRDGFWEELQEEWDKIDFSRFRIASSPDGILRYSEELGDYI